MQLGNHLGNVLVTVSDRKKGIADPLNAALIKFFEPVMLSGTDYYPFGMAMRVGGDNKYKFGFNGQEMSNEIKGEGNSYTAEFWEYDPRIGRRWNLDPRPVMGYSPYSTYTNNPIVLSDVLGDTAVVGAGGTQGIEIDETTNQLEFYGTQQYRMVGSGNWIPVKEGQLRSFTNTLGRFSATWDTDQLGNPVFLGYRNEKGWSLDVAIEKFKWNYALYQYSPEKLVLDWVDGMRRMQEEDPVKFANSLMFTHFMLYTPGTGGILGGGRGANPSVVTQESMSALGTIKQWRTPLLQQMVKGVDLPLPDPLANGYPHSVIGWKRSSTFEWYRQTATFTGSWPKANGVDVPISRVDWYHHGRPFDHSVPHQHPFFWNGQQWMQERGPGVPLLLK